MLWMVFQFRDEDWERMRKRTFIFQFITIWTQCFLLCLEYVLFAYIMKINLEFYVMYHNIIYMCVCIHIYMNVKTRGWVPRLNSKTHSTCDAAGNSKSGH